MFKAIILTQFKIAIAYLVFSLYISITYKTPLSLVFPYFIPFLKNNDSLEFSDFPVRDASRSYKNTLLIDYILLRKWYYGSSELVV